MITGILLILGLSLGSFVNALVWRLHQQSLPNKKRAASPQDLSITKGRSMCPNCKHTLGVLDLLPVVSWTLLRGRCRHCKRPISWQYPLAELVTALLFVGSYLFWPFVLASFLSYLLLATWLGALVALIALAVYDFKWMLLPNRIVFPLICIATVSIAIRLVAAEDQISVFLNALGGLAVAGGIFYVLFQVSDGKWIGGGDVKLGFALGLLLATPQLAFLMLFTSSLLGLIPALPALILRKTRLTSRMPFGPFLIAATIICMLFGQIIIDWYSNQFLYL